MMVRRKVATFRKPPAPFEGRYSSSAWENSAEETKNGPKRSEPWRSSGLAVPILLGAKGEVGIVGSGLEEDTFVAARSPLFEASSGLAWGDVAVRGDASCCAELGLGRSNANAPTTATKC